MKGYSMDLMGSTQDGGKMAKQQFCIVQYEFKGVENGPDKMGDRVSGCTEKWVYKGGHCLTKCPKQ